RLKGAVVEPALQPGERLAGGSVADDEADAPAGRREGRGRRVEPHRDVLGARDLEDGGRLVAVEAEIRVGEVVDDEDLVPSREGDDALHELELDRSRRRVVREGEDDDAR